jgi:hypothetical protein
MLLDILQSTENLNKISQTDCVLYSKNSVCSAVNLLSVLIDTFKEGIPVFYRFKNVWSP